MQGSLEALSRAGASSAIKPADRMSPSAPTPLIAICARRECSLELPGRCRQAQREQQTPILPGLGWCQQSKQGFGPSRSPPKGF